mmetsp:Transcript_37709/g.69659  ORF Transcript_37709/g.69659 Transcript_37709/m.69659 type:complete len:191 (-) Transcript_37709:131-703(-)
MGGASLTLLFILTPRVVRLRRKFVLISTNRIRQSLLVATTTWPSLPSFIDVAADGLLHFSSSHTKYIKDATASIHDTSWILHGRPTRWQARGREPNSSRTVVFERIIPPVLRGAARLSVVRTFPRIYSGEEPNAVDQEREDNNDKYRINYPGFVLDRIVDCPITAGGAFCTMNIIGQCQRKDNNSLRIRG